MPRARSPQRTGRDGRRLLAIVALSLFAVVNQPLSLALHAWSEANAAGTPAAAGDGIRVDRGAAHAGHDASTCPTCRTASQMRYSLVVALHASVLPLHFERSTLDDRPHLAARSAPPADAPRAPPLAA